jgi:hypothetical protein
MFGRGRGRGRGHGRGVGPPPTIHEFLAMQTQLMEALVNNQQNQPVGGAPARDKRGEFFLKHKLWGKAPQQPKRTICQESQTYRGSNQRLEKTGKERKETTYLLGGHCRTKQELATNKN